MGFKIGDIVIKTTGGNKMTISEIYNSNISGNIYKCTWFVDSTFNESSFSEDEIVSLLDYKRFLKMEERDDKINQILK